MAAHGLEIGSLDVVDGLSDEGYTIRVLGDDATFGSAQAVVKEIVSMLADGDLATYDRSGNRVATFDLEITGSDGLALALGEKALRAELYKPNTVTWTPPSDFAPVSVYEVITSDMSQSFNDLDEIRTRRIMRVTLTCSPFARSADLVTIEPLPADGAAAAVVVDDCTSTTGWKPQHMSAGADLDLLAVVDGAVVTTDANADDTLALFRGAPVDMSAHAYLYLDWKRSPTGSVQFFNSGLTEVVGEVVPELTRVALPDGWHRSWFAPSSLPNGFRLSSSTTYTPAATDALSISQVVQTNLPPGETPRQITRIIETGGTERTPGSIHVESANGADLLSTTIVHTCPEDGSGYSPPLRRWRDSGNTITTDTGTFSGEREPIHPNPFVAKVPTSAMPEGGYLLAAFLRCTTAEAVQIFWTLGTIPPGGTRTGDLEESIMWTFVANVWMLVPLGVVSLPTLRTKSGEIQIDILRDAASTAQVEIDDAWLFREGDDCALSVVNVAYPNLWLDSADLDNPVPTVWVGADAQTRTHPGTGLVAMGTHVLNPDGTALFTASSNSDYPAAEATFYRRWHSNAAE